MKNVPFCNFCVWVLYYSFLSFSYLHKQKVHHYDVNLLTHSPLQNLQGFPVASLVVNG